MRVAAISKLSVVITTSAQADVACKTWKIRVAYLPNWLYTGVSVRRIPPSRKKSPILDQSSQNPGITGIRHSCLSPSSHAIEWFKAQWYPILRWLNLESESPTIATMGDRRDSLAHWLILQINRFKIPHAFEKLLHKPIAFRRHANIIQVQYPLIEWQRIVSASFKSVRRSVRATACLIAS